MLPNEFREAATSRDKKIRFKSKCDPENKLVEKVKITSKFTSKPTSLNNKRPQYRNCCGSKSVLV